MDPSVTGPVLIVIGVILGGAIIAFLLSRIFDSSRRG